MWLIMLDKYFWVKGKKHTAKCVEILTVADFFSVLRSISNFCLLHISSF